MVITKPCFSSATQFLLFSLLQKILHKILSLPSLPTVLCKDEIESLSQMKNIGPLIPYECIKVVISPILFLTPYRSESPAANKSLALSDSSSPRNRLSLTFLNSFRLYFKQSFLSSDRSTPRASSQDPTRMTRSHCTHLALHTTHAAAAANTTAMRHASLMAQPLPTQLPL